MSVVVSDTSPIRALEHLGLTWLLQRLYGEVLIPPAVAEELRDTAAGLPPLDWAGISGLRVQAPNDTARVIELLRELHRGESEAIALAIEVEAAALIVDERAARSVALSLGVRPIGVLGMLVRAKNEGLVAAVGPLMERLRAGIAFRISPVLWAEILRLAGE